MVNLTKLFNKLADLGVDFFTGVPDSLLNDFCLYACIILITNIMLWRLMRVMQGHCIGHYLPQETSLLCI